MFFKKILQQKRKNEKKVEIIIFFKNCTKFYQISTKFRY
jgi:hypothetical protein